MIKFNEDGILEGTSIENYAFLYDTDIYAFPLMNLLRNLKIPFTSVASELPTFEIRIYKNYLNVFGSPELYGKIIKDYNGDIFVTYEENRPSKFVEPDNDVWTYKSIAEYFHVCSDSDCSLTEKNYMNLTNSIPRTFISDLIGKLITEGYKTDTEGIYAEYYVDSRTHEIDFRLSVKDGLKEQKIKNVNLRLKIFLDKKCKLVPCLSFNGGFELYYKTAEDMVNALKGGNLSEKCYFSFVR